MLDRPIAPITPSSRSSSRLVSISSKDTPPPVSIQRRCTTGTWSTPSRRHSRSAPARSSSRVVAAYQSPFARRAPRAAELADEHDVVGVRRERLPHDPAGHVGAVVPGGVEDPDAALVCVLHRAHTRLAIGGLAEDPRSGQPHGSKAHPRYGAPTERNGARMICQSHVVEAATMHKSTGSLARWQSVVAEVIDDRGGDLQGRGGAADVAGPDAVAGGGFDRPLDGLGLVVEAEVLEHEGGAADCPDGVAGSLAGDVGCGAVDGLEH